MERDQNAALTGVWNMLIPTIMDDLKEFRTSLEEITADMLETSREVMLEMEPEQVNKLLKYHDKTLIDEKLLPMGE